MADLGDSLSGFATGMSCDKRRKLWSAGAAVGACPKRRANRLDRQQLPLDQCAHDRVQAHIQAGADGWAGIWPVGLGVSSQHVGLNRPKQRRDV
jgi:hypothetical protein